MCNNATTLFLRCMLGYTNEELVHHECMTLGDQVRLLISWHEYICSNSVMRCMHVLHNDLEVD